MKRHAVELRQLGLWGHLPSIAAALPSFMKAYDLALSLQADTRMTRLRSALIIFALIIAAIAGLTYISGVNVADLVAVRHSIKSENDPKQKGRVENEIATIKTPSDVEIKGVELTLQSSPEAASLVPAAFPSKTWESLYAAALVNDQLALEDLHRELAKCRFQPGTEEELQSLIGSFYRDLSLDEATRFEQKSRLRYNACHAIPEHIRKAYEADLLRRRAELGSNQAKIDYINLARPTDVNSMSFSDDVRAYKEHSMEYLQEIISSGDRAGLDATALAYRRGSIYRRNDSLAYTYTYAYALTLETPNPDVTRRLARMEEFLGSDAIEPLRRNAENISHCCL